MNYFSSCTNQSFLLICYKQKSTVFQNIFFMRILHILQWHIQNICTKTWFWKSREGQQFRISPKDEKKKAIDVLLFYTGDDKEDEIRTFLVFMSPVTNSCHRETLNSVSGKFSFKHLVFQSHSPRVYCIVIGVDFGENRILRK